ncbi:MAG: hypothetical protein M1610_02150 [Nitrospirae bacterium]|jgi:hypothetical protein|nr:hypothetical protein [Nitrospirota bacterium]MCL5061863.1 hypothetical protein [Nitrospirota bacterium]MDA8214497.1 hypothetical protein [Nitrospiraceae bacterium]MDA8339753.1 hypothetical protein [Nitrospiraceae bacterium]
MICRRENRLIYLLKPISVVLLLFSIFSIVWLRSSFVSLEYRISSLEKKKTVLMRDMKMLAADRANLMSVERFEKVANNGTVNGGFAFPDRVKVVHVKKAKDKESYMAAFNKK